MRIFQTSNIELHETIYFSLSLLAEIAEGDVQLKYTFFLTKHGLPNSSLKCRIQFPSQTKHIKLKGCFKQIQS